MRVGLFIASLALILVACSAVNYRLTFNENIDSESHVLSVPSIVNTLANTVENIVQNQQGVVDVTKPAAGATYLSYEEIPIDWTVTEPGQSFAIQLLKEDGTLYQRIVDSEYQVAKRTGGFSIFVDPHIPTGNYKIKVFQSGDEASGKESGLFAIKQSDEKKPKLRGWVIALIVIYASFWGFSISFTCLTLCISCLCCCVGSLSAFAS